MKHRVVHGTLEQFFEIGLIGIGFSSVSDLGSGGGGDSFSFLGD